jgi:hypothetical protein
MRLSARLAVAAVAAVTASLLLTGCGSASEPSAPSGVDELVIPSPSLDPADFVASIDNPWLPLTPGSRWEYRSTLPGQTRTVTVTVLEETRVIQGVTATVVETVRPGVRPAYSVRSYDWFAQDVDGNVWHLGQAVRRSPIWEAGVGGSEAGLAMAADPRVGDGFATGYAPGLAEDVAQVVSLDGSASVPYGDLTGLVETEVTTPLLPGVVELQAYARGIGLVRSLENGEGDELLELVAFTS